MAKNRKNQQECLFAKKKCSNDNTERLNQMIGITSAKRKKRVKTPICFREGKKKSVSVR